MNLSKQRDDGESINSSNIRMHRRDVFRFVELLPDDCELIVSDRIRENLVDFIHQTQVDPKFEYYDLRLDLTLDEATEIMRRYYRLELS